MGRYEGMTDPAVHRLTAEVLRAWVVDHDLERKIADGETGHEVVARTTAALRVITQAHRGETVAVVGHVAGLTAALTALCRLGAGIWGAPLPHAHPSPWTSTAKSVTALPGPGRSCGGQRIRSGSDGVIFEDLRPSVRPAVTSDANLGIRGVTHG
ncbi:histidine phosphatase family protein [Microbispora sp. KK1-11]|uniref:histidine phosphatase family protein n=1 Tax=Microbispora sp. KK1-11 TaxID=2053005 RepID=UPI0037CC7479